MKIRTLRLVGAVLAVGLIAGVAGCKSMPKLKYKPHWPWSHKAAPAEAQANQVSWEAVEGGTLVEFPQSWLRNTLIINMSGASGSGSVRMKPKASMGWPVRMALRVKPGSIASVEFAGEQRLIIPVLASPAPSVDLAIEPDAYQAHTPVITLSWR